VQSAWGKIRTGGSFSTRRSIVAFKERNLGQTPTTTGSELRGHSLSKGGRFPWSQVKLRAREVLGILNTRALPALSPLPVHNFQWDTNIRGVFLKYSNPFVNSILEQRCKKSRTSSSKEVKAKNERPLTRCGSLLHERR